MFQLCSVSDNVTVTGCMKQTVQFSPLFIQVVKNTFFAGKRISVHVSQSVLLSQIFRPFL